jgi:hypothetical protein
VTSAANYETFKQMHFVCFHDEFEHDPADVDSVCTAGGYPSEVAGAPDALLTSFRWWWLFTTAGYGVLR